MHVSSARQDQGQGLRHHRSLCHVFAHIARSAARPTLYRIQVSYSCAPVRSALKFEGWELTEYSGVLAVDSDLCFFDGDVDGRRAMNITSFMDSALATLEDDQQAADILAVAEDRVHTVM